MDRSPESGRNADRNTDGRRTDGVNRGKPKVTNGFSNKLAGGNCKQRQTAEKSRARARERER